MTPADRMNTAGDESGGNTGRSYIGKKLKGSYLRT